MKTTAWIGAMALAGLVLAAGLRRSAPETPRPPGKPRKEIPTAAVAAGRRRPGPSADRRAAKIRPDEVESFVSASREVVRELRRLQIQWQSEWSIELDQQARLEWEERYDADRSAAVGRLEPFLDGGERHREFREQIDTWAATVCAREAKIENRKPKTE